MIIQNLSLLFSNPLGFLLILLCMLPGLLLAFSCHEAGHAFVAHMCGDDTAKNLGRLSLDPVRHIDPMGFLCLMLFGIGWAKPVPVNPNNYKNRRTGTFWVAISGVLTNFLLGVLFILIYVLCLKFRLTNDILLDVVGYAATFNFMLMLFNLLPIGPLDGMGIVDAILWKNSYGFDQFMARYGYIILLVLLFTGVLGTWISVAGGFLMREIQLLFFALFGV